MSRAQIIATLGPSSREYPIVLDMAKHHMDIARLNLSWGTHEEHAQRIACVREVAKEVGRPLLILADLSGPRVQKEKGHVFDAHAARVLTEKDLFDLDFIAEQNVDLVAMSFVGSADDVRDVRAEMILRGIHAPLIAKIERKEAVEHIDTILEAADAVMIARGDLGDAVPFEQIPFIQKDIIAKANALKKPVIVATQMLLSMTEAKEPTRAEVSDVAEAILEGADAVMLSEETAQGRYPVLAVEAMERIVLEAEKNSAQTEMHPL